MLDLSACQLACFQMWNLISTMWYLLTCVYSVKHHSLSLNNPTSTDQEHLTKPGLILLWNTYSSTKIRILRSTGRTETMKHSKILFPLLRGLYWLFSDSHSLMSSVHVFTDRFSAWIQIPLNILHHLFQTRLSFLEELGVRLKPLLLGT